MGGGKLKASRSDQITFVRYTSNLGLAHILDQTKELLPLQTIAIKMTPAPISLWIRVMRAHREEGRQALRGKAMPAAFYCGLPRQQSNSYILLRFQEMAGAWP